MNFDMTLHFLNNRIAAYIWQSLRWVKHQVNCNHEKKVFNLPLRIQSSIFSYEWCGVFSKYFNLLTTGQTHAVFYGVLVVMWYLDFSCHFPVRKELVVNYWHSASACPSYDFPIQYAFYIPKHFIGWLHTILSI